MDIISYILSRKYCDNAIVGLGAIKGANCTVKDIVHQDGINTVTFEWEGTDGTKKTRDMVVYDGTPIYVWESGNTYHYGDLAIYESQFYRCIVENSDVVFDNTKWNEIGSPDGNYDIVQSKALLPARFTAADRKLYFVIDEYIFYLWDGTQWVALNNVVQVTSFPEASAKYLNKIYQYIGNTDANYTHGFFYQCILSGTNPIVYSWEYVEPSENRLYVGTEAAYNALTPTEKAKYTTLHFTDDGQIIDLGIYLRKVQTMPSAADCQSETVMYVGATTADYTRGYIYRSTPSVVSGETVYNWVRQDAQPYVQADYAQTDINAVDYIKNKPNLGTASEKNFTDNVRPNSHDLVESNAVYNAISSSIASIYKPHGDLTCAELTSDLLIPTNIGNVYNMTDSGTTNALFIQGAGKTIHVNDTVGIIQADNSEVMFNLMGSMLDLHDYQTKELETPLIVGGVEQTDVEDTLGALNTELETKQTIIQYDTLPTASYNYLNKIIQYVGENTDTLIQGRFYKCVSDGLTPATYSWEIVELNKDHSASYARVIINKSHNALPDAFQTIADGNGYYTCIKALNPSTTYKMWIKPDKSCSITSWNNNYFINTTTGAMSTDGQWITFTTKDNSNFGSATYQYTWMFNTNITNINFDNLCAIEEQYWTNGMLPFDSTGFVYTLPFSIHKNDSFYCKNGMWFKKNEDDLFGVEETQLSARVSTIFNTIANLSDNGYNNYDISIVDEKGNAVYDVNKIFVEDVDYVQTSDYRFVYKDTEYQINAMNLVSAGLIGNSNEFLTNGVLYPHSWFDIIHMGYNTVQVHVYNSMFFTSNSGTARNPEDYQIFFDSMDIGLALGLRLIFKFYSFDWTNNDIQTNTMTLEKMIVDKYKNNPQVIGYSIANEPGNCGYRPSNPEHVVRYTSFVQEIQTYIRNNTNQIMFFELETGIDLTAPNTAFEYHYYAPSWFTGQPTGTSETTHYYYPDENRGLTASSLPIADHGDRSLYLQTSVTSTSSYPTSIKFNNDSNPINYTEISRGKYDLNLDISKYAENIGNIRFLGGKDGVHFRIKGWTFNYYDKDGNLVRSKTKTIASNEDLSKYNFTNTSLVVSDYVSVVQDGDDYALEFSFHSLTSAQLQSSTYMVDYMNPHNDEVAMEFVVNVSGYSDGVTSYATVDTPTSQYYWKFAMSFTTDFNNDCLEYLINNCAEMFHMPLYIGEVGTMSSTYPSDKSQWSDPTTDRGGVNWAESIIRAMNKHGISYAYFQYYGSAFCLYQTHSKAHMYYQWGRPLYNKLVSLGNELVNNDPIMKLSTEPTRYDKRAITSNAVFEIQTQYNVMPTASRLWIDRIIQYVGETDNNYTNGYWYKCVQPSSTTYAWRYINSDATTFNTNDFNVVNNEVSIINHLKEVSALPTPSSTYLDKVYLLTSTQAGYQKGGIYQCVSDGEATPTYSWQLISSADMVEFTAQELQAMW